MLAPCEKNEPSELVNKGRAENKDGADSAIKLSIFIRIECNICLQRGCEYDFEKRVKKYLKGNWSHSAVCLVLFYEVLRHQP